MGRRLFYVRQLKHLAASLAGFIAILGLFGWLLGRSSLYTVSPNWSSMVPWTSALFIVLVGALLLAPQRNAADESHGTRDYLAACLATCALALSLAFVLSHALGRDLGLDQLLFPGSVANDPPQHPGRMSLTTALLFALTSLGVLTSSVFGQRGRRVGESAGLAALILSLLVLVCYLYGAANVHRIAVFGSISVLTALCMALVAVATMAMSVDNQLMHMLLADDGGGAVLRRLVMPVMLVPVVVEWGRSMMYSRGWVSQEFSVAASSVVHILLLGGLIVWTAYGISSYEARIARSEAEQRRLAEVNARLVEELNHRVRNNLASLRSLIAINRKRATGLDQFATYVDRGVSSIAGVYSMLVDRANGGLDVRRMLGETLKQLHVTHGRPALAVHMEGPMLELAVRQVLPLALTVAELYTNCVWHGAGMSANGMLSLNWSEDSEAGGMLHLEWIESGGPAIEGMIVPSTGIELIRGFVDYELGGSCTLRFPAGGVHHTFIIPLSLPEPASLSLRLTAG